MPALERRLHKCGLEELLLPLIKLRASQLNECACCLDMQWKDLKALGEQHQRLQELDDGHLRRSRRKHWHFDYGF